MEIPKDKAAKVKEKISKFIVYLDSVEGGTALAEVEFDMTSNLSENSRPMRLFLNQSSENTAFKISPEDNYIDISLKGKNMEGLIKERISEIQDKLGKSIANAARKRGVSGSPSPKAKVNSLPDSSPSRMNFDLDLANT